MMRQETEKLIKMMEAKKEIAAFLARCKTQQHQHKVQRTAYQMAYGQRRYANAQHRKIIARSSVIFRG